MMLDSKVVKSDSKIVISLRWSVTHSVVNRRKDNYSKKQISKIKSFFRRITESMNSIEKRKKSFWRELTTKVPKITIFPPLLCMKNFFIGKKKFEDEKKKLSFILRGIVKPLEEILFFYQVRRKRVFHYCFCCYLNLLFSKVKRIL